MATRQKIGHSTVDRAGSRARCSPLCVLVFSDVRVGLASKPAGLLGQQLFCTDGCMKDHAMKKKVSIKETE